VTTTAPTPRDLWDPHRRPRVTPQQEAEAALAVLSIAPAEMLLAMGCKGVRDVAQCPVARYLNRVVGGGAWLVSPVRALLEPDDLDDWGPAIPLPEAVMAFVFDFDNGVHSYLLERPAA
jgi:hypothetical protein